MESGRNLAAVRTGHQLIVCLPTAKAEESRTHSELASGCAKFCRWTRAAVGVQELQAPQSLLSSLPANQEDDSCGDMIHIRGASPAPSEKAISLALEESAFPLEW